MSRTYVVGSFPSVACSHTIRRIPTPLARSYYIPSHSRMVGTILLEARKVARVFQRYWSYTSKIPWDLTPSPPTFDGSYGLSHEVVKFVNSSTAHSSRPLQRSWYRAAGKLQKIASTTPEIQALQPVGGCINRPALKKRPN